MKIGIYSKDVESLHSNGCNQQSIFVYELYNSIKNIECQIITDKRQKFLNTNAISIMEDWDKILEMDVLICISKKLGIEKYLKELKERNIKIIEYNCGNLYYIIQEDIIFGKHNYIASIEYYKYYDQFWVIPNYSKNKDFYQSYTGISDFRTIPYVWNSTITDLWIEKNSPIFYDNKTCYKTDTKYIIICEPNIQITKNSIIPLLICNQLYKSGYKNIKVICLCKLNNKAFITFCNNLLICRDGMVEFYDRLLFYNIIEQFKNKKLEIFILSHHKDNPLNFLHLETLYLNYPLIHNTDEYKEVGYHYNNINEAVQKLKYSFINHKKDLTEYQNKVGILLEKFSPYNKYNQEIYKKYLTK